MRKPRRYEKRKKKRRTKGKNMVSLGVPTIISCVRLFVHFNITFSFDVQMYFQFSTVRIVFFSHSHQSLYSVDHCIWFLFKICFNEKFEWTAAKQGRLEVAQ